MGVGRTFFFPKDAGWWRRERIVAAGLEMERAPAVLDWLTCEAKAQSSGPRDQMGWVKTGYAAVAHGATFGHATAEDIRPVVSLLVHVRLLDDFEDLGHGMFRCRISGWREDVYLTLEASRKAEERNAKQGKDTKSGSSKPKSSAGTNRDTSQDVPDDPAASLKGKESRADVSSDEDTSGARATDPDALPEDLPEHLRPVVPLVVERLQRLAAAKGAQVVTVAAVGRALAALPDRDHVAVADDVEHYWAHGQGQSKRMRDVVQTYRNRLKSEPAAARPALEALSGGADEDPGDRFRRAPQGGGWRGAA